MINYLPLAILFFILIPTQAHALMNDEQETLYYWDKEEITVTLVQTPHLIDPVWDRIEEAVTSTEFYTIEDNKLHKMPPGYYSPYYLGWQGALDNTPSTNLKLNFQVTRAHVGDIIISVTPQSSPHGRSGEALPQFVDGKLNKVYVNLYNIDEMTPNSIYGLTMHELGHALGLGHSTAPEEIMHEKIGYNNLWYPYVTPCMMEALDVAYQGNKTSVVCSK